MNKYIWLTFLGCAGLASAATVQCTVNPLGLVDKIVCVPVGNGDVVTDGTSILTSAGYIDMGAGTWTPPTATVATLPPAAANEGKVYWVTDSAGSGDCTVGGAGGDAWCRSNGSSWASVSPPGEATWGAITGTLASQTDLAAALAAKQVKGYTSVSFSATPTFSASATNAFLITLTGNVTSSTFSSPGTGQYYTFRICQDGTGSRTFVWPSGFALAGTIQSTLSGCSNQSFFWNGAAAIPLGPMYDTDVTGSNLVLYGSTSGNVTVVPTAIAGTTVLTIPATTGTIALDLAGNGLYARTGTGTGTARTITGTSGTITVTNGDGVSGNPTLTIAAALDLSGQTSTKPSKAGTSLPATCGVGETYIKTDATNTNQLYICTATNTWTAQGGSGSGGIAPIRFMAAKCANGTAGPGVSMPASLAPTPQCITGTNILSGELDFADSGGEISIQDRFPIPAGSSGPVSVIARWRTAATSGNVVWQLQGICVADTESLDTAMATAQAFTADAADATTLRANSVTLSSPTITSCAAGETYFFRFFRDGGHASDTIANVAKLLSLEFTF